MTSTVYRYTLKDQNKSTLGSIHALVTSIDMEFFKITIHVDNEKNPNNSKCGKKWRNCDHATYILVKNEKHLRTHHSSIFFNVKK